MCIIALNRKGANKNENLSSSYNTPWEFPIEQTNNQTRESYIFEKSVWPIWNSWRGNIDILAWRAKFLCLVEEERWLVVVSVAWTTLYRERRLSCDHPPLSPLFTPFTHPFLVAPCGKTDPLAYPLSTVTFVPSSTGAISFRGQHCLLDQRIFRKWIEWR